MPEPAMVASRFRRWRRLFSVGLIGVGLGSMMLIALAFTTIPYRAYQCLAVASSGSVETPDVIVVLGGGGIPSESGLMRCYVGAQVAGAYPGARVVVALPGDARDPESGVRRMHREMVMRGVDAGRLGMEATGRNTHEQAVALAGQLLVKGAVPRVVVVTSPDHVRRSVLSLQRAGFEHVLGIPAYEQSAESDLRILPDESGEAPRLSVVDGSLLMRYRFWTNLNYVLRVAREWAALAYYRVRGWI